MSILVILLTDKQTETDIRWRKHNLGGN